HVAYELERNSNRHFRPIGCAGRRSHTGTLQRHSACDRHPRPFEGVQAVSEGVPLNAPILFAIPRRSPINRTLASWAPWAGGILGFGQSVRIRQEDPWPLTGRSGSVWCLGSPWSTAPEPARTPMAPAPGKSACPGPRLAEVAGGFFLADEPRKPTTPSRQEIARATIPALMPLRRVTSFLPTPDSFR